LFGGSFLPRHFHELHRQGQVKDQRDLDSFSCPADKKIFGFTVHDIEVFQSKYTAGLADELVKRNFRSFTSSEIICSAVFLSKQVALGDQVWSDTNGNSPSTLKVTLSSRHLFVDITQTLANAERTRLMFGNLPFFELSYEALCANFSRQFARVCEFLGASHEKVTPKIFKQENRPMREAIANYERLKLLFSITKYRRFFEE
jgi:hypothetical protein